MSKPTEDPVATVERFRADAIQDLGAAMRELEAVKSKVSCLKERVKVLTELVENMKPGATISHPDFAQMGRYRHFTLNDAVLDLLARTEEPMRIVDIRQELQNNGFPVTSRNFTIAIHQAVGRLAARGKVATSTDEKGAKLVRAAKTLQTSAA